MSFRIITLLLLSTLALGGCSKYMSKLDKVLPDQRESYKKSASLPDLEVPPDLTTDAIDDSLVVPEIDASGTASFSEYEDRVQRQKDARFYGTTSSDPSGISDVAGEQYFVVNTGMDETWQTITQTWQELGYSLDLNDQELGVMETSWKTDSAKGLRDRFKMFIEPAQSSGATAIYLSHSGEEKQGGSWYDRGRDVSVEYAMAEYIQSELGGAPVATSTSTTVSTPTATESAAPASNAPTELIAEIVSAGGGKMYLAVNRSIETLWTTVGSILSGYDDITLDGEDRSNGTYSFEFKPESGKKGMFSRLAFWKDGALDQQLQLTAIGDKTEIVVLDEDGEWDTSDVSDEILQRLRSGL